MRSSKITMLAVLLFAASFAFAQQDTTPGTNTQPSSTEPQGKTGQPQGSQENPAPASAQPAAPQTNATANEGNAASATMKGCLSGTPMSGTYTLQDEHTGTSYHLTGNFETLRMLVGNEVQVTGQVTSPSGTSADSAAATGNVGDQTGAAASNGKGASTRATTSLTGNIFQVNSATKVADHCSGAGSGAGSSSAAPGSQANAE